MVRRLKADGPPAEPVVVPRPPVVGSAVPVAGADTGVRVVMTRPRGSAIAGEIGWITGASARPCNAEPGACHRVTTGNRAATGLTAAPGPAAKSDPGVAL